MKIVTVDTLQGVNYEEMGVVTGNTIQSKNFVSDFGQGLKSIVGGELKSYTEMMEKAREKATQRMIDQAVRMGADLVFVPSVDHQHHGVETGLCPWLHKQSQGVGIGGETSDGGPKDITDSIVPGKLL